MIPYIGEEVAKTHTHSSGDRIQAFCPDCGRKKDNLIIISNIYKTHSIGCTCSDKNSYPEKLIFALQKQLDIDFKTQLSKTDFEWCKEYKYDFYFKINNEEHIIETHGKQHYEEGFERIKSSKKIRSLEEEQENDRLKKELALQNGIKEENYIVIDCRKSELEWIKNNENGILNSRLNELFDLSNINWNKAEEFALSNLVKKACELKRDNPEMTTIDIGEIIGVHQATIINYLKKGSKIWDWCNYNPKEEVRKSSSKSGKLNGKPIEIFKDGKPLGKFLSCSDLERQSEDKFGVKLTHGNISATCIGMYKQYKGFTFKYVV